MKNRSNEIRSNEIRIRREPSVYILPHPHENQSKFLGQQEWVEILMITLVSSKFLAMHNTMLYSVFKFLSSTEELQCGVSIKFYIEPILLCCMQVCIEI